MATHNHSGSNGFFLPDLCNTRAVIFLVLVAELLALVVVLAGDEVPGFDLLRLGLTSMYVQWVVLLSASMLCIGRGVLSRLTLPAAACISYLLILVVAVAVNVVGQWLTAGMLWLIDLYEVIRVLLITAVLAGIALRYFYLTRQLQLRQQAELEARIQALQARIRPHFLFNSMNIIASLIAVDQRAAETAVEDLAALFRASLSLSDTEVPLRKELDLCQRYARIESLRLGDRLRVDWRVDSLPEAIRIPALSLQPLLENAIYHGIQQLPEGGTVTVLGVYDNDEVCITVDNPVEPDESSSDRGNRLAQDNTRLRLQALYGVHAGLEVMEEPERYRVTLHYPFVLPEGAA